MADQAPNNLTYGRFGQAVYNSEHRQWNFKRLPSHTSSWQVLGDSNVVISSTSTQGTTTRGPGRREAASARRKKQIKALIQSNPELQPASDLLPDLARVSEASEDAAARYDPARGTLIAYGTIPDEASKKSLIVAAFPSGPTGGDLRVVEVQKQRRGWSHSRDAWLEVPTIYGEGATWKGPGAPIQSVSFAQPIDSNDAFLAVRLITRTLIFQPILRRGSGQRPPRLDIRLSFELHIKQTGDLPHADVSFNPWHFRHFAVADQRSSWSVWKLGKRQTVRAKQTCNGSLTEDSSITKPIDDGWGRVTWVGSSSTLAVCNRRKLKLFDVANQEPLIIQDIEVVLDNGVGWILDLSLLQSWPSHLCVLTSTHILIYRIAADDGDAVSVNCLLKFQHFRRAEDISMKLHFLSDGDDVLVLIRSSISSTIMSYRLKSHGEGLLALEDPNELPLSPAGHGSEIANGISDLHFEAITMESKRNSSNHPTLDNAIDCTERGVRFYSLNTLHRDISLRQTLYFAAPRSGIPVRLESPTWESRLSKGANQMPEIESSRSIYENYAPLTSRTKPLSTYILRRMEQQSLRSGNEWTVSYKLSVHRLNDVDVSEVTGTEEIVEEVRHLLQTGYTDDAAAIRTLREMVDGEITVRDVDEASVSFRDLRLVESFTHESRHVATVDEPDEASPRLVLQMITLPPELNPDLGELNDLSSVHRTLVKGWITPLSGNTPDVIRMSIEQLARRIAAEVSLASQVLRIEDAEREQQTQSQPQAWDLPFRLGASGSPSHALPSLYFDNSSQAPPSSLPLPSASAPLSTTTGFSSHPSTFTTPEISRLSRYTTFSQPAPPALPRALNKVLSHWTPGTNPADYDWLNTSRHISRHDDEDPDGEEMTEKERMRLQRRAERYVRRQRREAEESQRARMLGSQAPEIVSAGQPSGSHIMRMESQRDAVAGSSQMSQAQISASQILPGRHGGRPPGRKKRKMGF